jgi:hypothetical protein
MHCGTTLYLLLCGSECADIVALMTYIILAYGMLIRTCLYGASCCVTVNLWTTVGKPLSSGETAEEKAESYKKKYGNRSGIVKKLLIVNQVTFSIPTWIL